ncbi:spermidine synthase [Streptomyces sp. NPDC012888]|uniref:spermidine synthase n=1 Tax=Streptomyces sp. NPDC012888 TaxID=3364855 RepID=UPI00368D6797
MPDVDRARGWLLTVDGAPQSYVDLDDPRHLEFEYARRLAHVLDCAAGADDAPLDLVHLGGGALTLPRYAAATRPGSRQDVVEFDGALVELVAEHLPTKGADIAVHTADARDWLERRPAASADVVLGDVFAGSRVPARLTSAEYAREVARVLRPGGIYAANLADGAPFDFLGTQLANLRPVFAELALIAEPAVLRGRRFGNAVLVASDAELPVAELARRCASDAFPARVEHGRALLRRATTPVPDGEARPSPEPPADTFTL